MRLLPKKVYGRHGREYEVRLVKDIRPSDNTPEGFQIQGQIDRTKGIIRIRKGIRREDQYMFLLHELLHDMVEDFAEYDLCEELYVEFLTGDLFDCLRRNRLGFYE
jgi:hypothetical protein